MLHNFIEKEKKKQNKEKEVVGRYVLSLVKGSKRGIAKLPKDIIKKICLEDYVNLLEYDFRDWVKSVENFDQKIDLKLLCSNKSLTAMKIIEKVILDGNANLLDWHELSKNPFAIDILRFPGNYESLEWETLSSNEEAIELLKDELRENPEENKINWEKLSINKKGFKMICDRMAVEKEIAISDSDAFNALRPNKRLYRAGLYANESTDVLNYLIKNPNENPKSWLHLSGNSNPKAIELLEKELKSNPNNIDISWRQISGNPGAVKLLKAELKKNPNSTKIDWRQISGNTGKGIMELIRWKIKRDGLPGPYVYVAGSLSWHELSSNPKAIFLLRDNQDKIKWDIFSSNPAIFSIKDISQLGNKEESSRSGSALRSPSPPSPPSPPPHSPPPPRINSDR